MRRLFLLATSCLCVLAGCSDAAPDKRPPGDPCVGNTDCAHTICHQGTCAAPAPKAGGATCSGDHECESWRCEEGTCAATGNRPDGEACLHAAECLSGRCDGGSCVGVPRADGGADGPAPDGPAPDSGPPDGAQPDSAPADGGPVDSSPVDSSPVDSSPVDSSPADSAPFDGPSADACTCQDTACYSATCDGKGGCDVSLKPGKCFIGGSCYASGATAPADLCQKCDPSTDTASWTLAANSGCVTTLAGTGSYGFTDGPALTATLNAPRALALDETGGRLYIADEYLSTLGAKIRYVDLKTNTVKTLVGPPGTATPVKGAQDGGPSQATFESVKGLCFGAGVLWVADAGNCLLRAVDPATGFVSTRAGKAGVCGGATPSDGPALTTARIRAKGCAVDSTGKKVYLASYYGVRLYDAGATPSPQVSTILNDLGHINKIFHIALRGDATAVYPLGHHIYTLALASGVETQLAGSSVPGHQDGAITGARFRWPQGLAVRGAAAGGAIVVADRDNHVVRRLVGDNTTGIASTPAGTPGVNTPQARDGRADLATFNQPTAVVVSSTGVIYVLDKNNRKIRLYTP